MIKHFSIVLAGLLLVALLTACGGSATDNTAAQVATPTDMPTPTPEVPLVQSAALYAAFQQAGIAMSASQINTAWSCCTYAPEGGAFSWQDLASGKPVEIATFARAEEPIVDGNARVAHDPGLTYNTYGGCLLLYNQNMDASSYIQVAQQTC